VATATHQQGSEPGHRHQLPDPDASPVLDIGGDVGALLLITGAERSGTEIEVQRLGDSGRTHTAVHPRHTPSGVLHAALYPALLAGDYELLLGPAGSAGNPRIAISGGILARHDCR
jgi:hypothetical protein